jgi:hypothetical protein
MRQNTEVVLWIFGVLFPSIVSFLFREYGFEMSLIYINIVLPALPYMVLALICRIADKIDIFSIIGATVTAAIVQIIIYAWYWRYAVIQHSPGGANIGLGLLFLFMPLYLPFIMALGGAISSTKRQRNNKENT